MSELQDAVDDLKICRLCLRLTVAKINIFTDDFARMIEMLTSLKIKPNDSLPQISCLRCARDVKTAFLVRRRIIQSYRAFTSRLNRLPPHSIRRSIREANNGTSTSTHFSSSNNESPINVERRQLEQVQSTVEASDTEENGRVSDNDSTFSHDSSDGLSQPADNNEGEPVQQELRDAKVKNQQLKSDSLKLNGIDNHINFKDKFSTESSEKLRNLKLAINTKYSDRLNTYKQRLYAWKLLNKKDQTHIIKWMEKKSINVNSTSNKSKLTPIQHNKREAIKMYCNTCQVKFTNKIAYKNHMNRHKHKTCPICDKQIRSVYLKKHMTLHEDSPAMCEVCGITCKNPVSLKMHFLYYHKSNLSICEDCGRSFKTKTRLLYHQRKDHTKERNYKCETCGKCFFAKVYLTKHINMKHMKMRPHICEYCGKGFSGKHALRTHIRQHTNEAPFHCNLCGERFRQRVSLKGHLKSRHKVEEKNTVFCDTCGKGFATAVALDVHSRLHAEIKCPWCSDTFAENLYLEQHISAIHPNAQYQDGVDISWMNF